MQRALVAGVVDQPAAVGQRVIQRKVFAVGRIVRIEGGAELRVDHVVRLVEALAGGQVIACRFVDVAAEQAKFTISDVEAALQADPALDHLRERPRGAILPLDLSRERIQCVDVGAVVVSDAGRCVYHPVLDYHPAGHRPGGDELRKDGNPAIGGRGPELPQEPSGRRLEGVDPAVGRAHEHAVQGNRGREIDRSAGECLPANLAAGRLQSPKHAALVADEHQVACRDRGGGNSAPREASRPSLLDLLGDRRGGDHRAPAVAAVGRPVAGLGPKRFDRRGVARPVLQSRVVRAGLEVEVSGTAQPNVTVERQLTPAHPRTPVEHPIGDDHAVLAGGAHGGDVLGRVGGRFDAHRPAGRAKENAVDAAGRPGAGPPSRQLGQHLAGFIVQLAASLQVAGRVESIVAEHQLDVAVLLLPEQSPVFGRSDYQPASLWTGEE